MRYFFILLSTLALAGCATIIEGTNQSVALESDPAGAACTVSRSGLDLGKVTSTPGSVHINKSKNDLTIVCSKDGYTTATLSQTPKFVGTTFGNIVAGGLIGVIVDASTGANYEYPGKIQMLLAIKPTTPVATYDATPFVLPALAERQIPGS